MSGDVGRGANDFRENMRLSRAQTTERINQYGSLVYCLHRYYAMKAVLERARLGSLHPDWRDRLTTSDYTRMLAISPAYQLYSDIDELLLAELRSTPQADWEPHSGVGWRRSLDAWFQASIDVLDQYRSANDILVNSVSVAAPVGQTAINNVQRHRQFAAVFERDMLEASYRAGLCAGGEAVDWRGWLRQRSADWPDAPTFAQFFDALEQPDFRDDLQTLPDYWRTP